MERNKLYTVTKASSDNVIRLGDLIWLSEDDVLHSIMYMGTCLRKNWDVPGQNDFQVEPCEKFHLGDCHGVPIPLRNRNYIVTDEEMIEKAQKLYLINEMKDVKKYFQFLSSDIIENILKDLTLTKKEVLLELYIHEKEKAKMTDYIRNMINSLAEDILDIYKIGFRVDDINDLVQKLGGSIQMKKDFSYASLEKNGDGFKIIVSSYQDEQRKRFAIAQELGHLFLHMGYKTNAEIWEKQVENSAEKRAYLYPHPQQISGVILKNDVRKVAEAIECMSLSSIRWVDLYDTVYVLSDEAYEKYLMFKDEALKKDLFDVCQTPRITRFYDAIEISRALAMKYRLKRLGINDGRNYGSGQTIDHIMRLMQKMSEDGLLVMTSPSGEETYVRSLNKTELKKWIRSHMMLIEQYRFLWSNRKG